MDFDKYFDKSTLFAGFAILFFLVGITVFFVQSLLLGLVFFIIDVLLWSAFVKVFDDV